MSGREDPDHDIAKAAVFDDGFEFMKKNAVHHGIEIVDPIEYEADPEQIVQDPVSRARRLLEYDVLGIECEEADQSDKKCNDHELAKTDAFGLIFQRLFL